MKPQGTGGGVDGEALRQGLDELRGVLSVIEAEVAGTAPTEDALRSLDHAVNGVRTDVWALLTAQYSDSYDAYLGKLRVRRSHEICEGVLADVYAETLPARTPGLQVFRATLDELSKVCHAVMAGEKPEY